MVELKLFIKVVISMRETPLEIGYKAGVNIPLIMEAITKETISVVIGWARGNM